MNNSTKVPSTTSDELCQWLRDHPLISLLALCKLVGYSRSNLRHALMGNRPIPDKYLPAFAYELAKYGFPK